MHNSNVPIRRETASSPSLPQRSRNIMRGRRTGLKESPVTPVSKACPLLIPPKQDEEEIRLKVNRIVAVSSSSQLCTTGSTDDEGVIPTTALGLLFSAAGLLVTSVGNSIFFKKMTDAMPNNSWFLSQVTSSAYIPVFAAVCIAPFLKGKLMEDLKFPKYKFAVMGLMDCLSGVCMLTGGAFTAGSTQVMLLQFVLPATLVLSVICLQIKYHWLQYLGAFVIVLGVLTVKVPDLIGSGGGSDILIFNLIFLCGGLPNAFSGVYKEVAFRDADLDVNYVQLMVAVFQVFCGFLVMPINSLAFLGPQRVPLTGIPSLIGSGLRCLFFGENTVVDDCGHLGQRVCDHCNAAWVPVLLYLIFNVMYNVFGLLVVKHGSATISLMVSTLRLPLTSFAFYSRSIMGDNAVKPRIWDFLGLAVLVLGLVFYRLGGLQKKS